MLREHRQGHSQDRRLSAIPRDSVDGIGAPPFWELEALIAAGCDLTEALVVIAARRDLHAGHALDIRSHRRTATWRDATEPGTLA